MLNREYIMNLEAGREMDALVAEKVMGWKPQTTDNTGLFYPICVWKDGDGHDVTSKQWTFNPSKDISSSWFVVEKMGDLGWMLYKVGHTLSNDGSGRITGYTCTFLNIESGASREVSGVSLPRTISRCALLTTIQGVDKK